MIADGLRESGNAVQRYTMKPQDVASIDKKPSDFVRRGSAGKVGSMMLLKSYQSMHAPFTQVPPNMFGPFDLHTTSEFSDQIVVNVTFIFFSNS